MNFKRKILYFALLIVLLLGLTWTVLFRNISFKSLASNYTNALDEQEEPNTSNESRDQTTPSVGVSFGLADFVSVYINHEDVTRNGITISGTDYQDVNYYSVLANQTYGANIPTTILMSHDKSWDSIESISINVALPHDFVDVRDLLLSLDLQALISEFPSSLFVNYLYANNGYIPTFVKPNLHPLIGFNTEIDINDSAVKQVVASDYESIIYSTKYSSVMFNKQLGPLYERLAGNDSPTIRVLAEFISLGKDSVTNIESQITREGLSIKTTFNDNVNGQVVADYGIIYSVRIVGYRADDAPFIDINKNLSRSTSHMLNSIGKISSVATIASLEDQFNNISDATLDIRFPTGQSVPSSEILYSALSKSGSLLDERVDLIFNIKKGRIDFDVPIALNPSAFYVADPREHECCEPTADSIATTAQKMSIDLNHWFESPDLAAEDRNYAYIMYYGSKTSYINSLKLNCDRCIPTWNRATAKATGQLPTVTLGQYIDYVNYVSARGPGSEGCSHSVDDLGGTDYWPDYYPAWVPDPHESHSFTSSYSSNDSSKDIRALCQNQDHLPMVSEDLNSYPNGTVGIGVLPDEYWDTKMLHHNWEQARLLTFKTTEPGELAQLKIRYPDTDQSNSTFSFYVPYIYLPNNLIISYSNSKNGVKSVENEIAMQVDLGDNSPTSEGLRPNSTYAAIETIIWNNIENFDFVGLPPQEYVPPIPDDPNVDGDQSRPEVPAAPAQYANPDYLDVVFWDSPAKTNRISPTTPLKYGSQQNKLYFSFEKDPTQPATVSTTGNVETIEPFTITDTTPKNIAPTGAEVGAGTMCVNSFVSQKLVNVEWSESTTYGDIQTALDNSMECIDAFGLKPYADQVSLKLYTDKEATMPINPAQTIGVINNDDPVKLYYRYVKDDTATFVNWWESIDMPTQFFRLEKGMNVYLGDENAEFVTSEIEQEISAIGEQFDNVTNAQLVASVESHKNELVIPEVANQITVKYFNKQNQPFDPSSNPNGVVGDNDTVNYTFTYQKTGNYVYYDDMQPTPIHINWDSTYVVNSNTTTVSESIESAILNQTMYIDGVQQAVASDALTYQMVKDQIAASYSSLFAANDAKYVNQDSLKLTENNLDVDLESLLTVGHHEIAYTYDLSSTNCSPYDVEGGDCHPIDGIILSGFDGVANTISIDVYHVIKISSAKPVSELEDLVRLAVLPLIDVDNDGYVDENLQSTYYSIVNAIEQTLMENNVLVDYDDWKYIDVQIKVTYRNDVGKSKYFMIDSTNIGQVINPKVTGIEYTLVGKKDSSAGAMIGFDNPTVNVSHFAWMGEEFIPASEPGTIYGSGNVLYWLIIGAFAVLIMLGILIGVVLIRKRKKEREGYA